MLYDFRVPNTQCIITQNRNPVTEQEPRDRTGHLADDKLAFCLIEIVRRNFEIELERNEQV